LGAWGWRLAGPGCGPGSCNQRTKTWRPVAATSAEVLRMAPSIGEYEAKVFHCRPGRETSVLPVIRHRAFTASHCICVPPILCLCSGAILGLRRAFRFGDKNVPKVAHQVGLGRAFPNRRSCQLFSANGSARTAGFASARRRGPFDLRRTPSRPE